MDQAWLVRDNGKGGVVTHAANGFLCVFDHRRQDQFHILERHSRGHLPPRQFGAGHQHREIFDAHQVVKRQEVADHFAIWRFGGKLVLQLEVVEQFSFL